MKFYYAGLTKDECVERAEDLFRKLVTKSQKSVGIKTD